MDPVLIPVVALVFSLSIPIAAIIIDHFNRKNKIIVKRNITDLALLYFLPNTMIYKFKI